ncbi:MAG: GNAT family N-acetyltransferase [Candidatus Zixiibacteriota bacterium]|nr:MAG: GNAT family N-acetyltransferase [candidate division Zixibacteria bacterium]
MSEEKQAAVNPESDVTLREITGDTVRTICDLKVSESQKGFVAPNAVSIAQAYFAKTAWFRAIYADDTPVGFLMLDKNTEKPEYFLWRLMIDERYQRMGFGYMAMELLIEYVRSLPGAAEFLTSCVPGDGSPERFYNKLGFTRTGEMDGGEVVMRLPLK